MKIGILENKESPATDYYVSVGPFQRLAKTNPEYEIITITTNSSWSDYAKCDVVIFSRPNGDAMLGLMRDCKQMKVKIIAIHDDLLTDVPLTNPASAHFNREDVKKTTYECFNLADHVIVTTPVLKDAFKDYHKGITVIPNGVDLKFTPFTKEIKHNPAQRIKSIPKTHEINPQNPDALIKILWRGSMTHGADLKTIDSFWQWATLTKDTTVGFIGMPAWYAATHHPGVLSRDWRAFFFNYFEELRFTGADYGVFPLVNNPFNHAKSGNFAAEMLGAGIVPYAPVGFAEFAHPGVRHYSSSGELIKEFMNLLKDDQDYHLTIEEGRQWIIENRDVEKLNIQRVEILENL